MIVWFGHLNAENLANGFGFIIFCAAIAVGVYIFYDGFWGRSSRLGLKVPAIILSAFAFATAALMLYVMVRL